MAFMMCMASDRYRTDPPNDVRWRVRCSSVVHRVFELKSESEDTLFEGGVLVGCFHAIKAPSL